MGAVSPNGVGRDAFWHATRSGISGVSQIEQFDVSDLPVGIAAQVREFDSESVMTRNELRHVSRTVPLGIAAAEEALRDSLHGELDLDLETRRRFAVVIGTGGAGLEFTERQFREFFVGNPKSISLYAIPSSTPGSLSSELSMRFDLRGPSHVISTGCTSSIDAIGRALDLIRYGRCDRALAGGTDSPIAPGILRGFCLMRILSTQHNDEPTRASRPFSADRDGFVLGEGAWMLALESLESAIQRDAPIYGELLGYGATCEAFHRVRLNESGEEPARAMTLAMLDAGIDAAAIDYIALHGTSTRLNDRVETVAVQRAFASNHERILCSSIKSMIGHPQGACGAASSVATLLAMRDGFAPPTINRDIADPECDLDVVPAEGRPARLDHCLVNCIGFGSKNAALVFRHPDRIEPEVDGP